MKRKRDKTRKKEIASVDKAFDVPDLTEALAEYCVTLDDYADKQGGFKGKLGPSKGQLGPIGCPDIEVVAVGMMDVDDLELPDIEDLLRRSCVTSLEPPQQIVTILSNGAGQARMTQR